MAGVPPLYSAVAASVRALEAAGMNAPTLSPLESDLANILADALVADFLARPPAWALADGTVESPPGADRETAPIAEAAQ